MNGKLKLALSAAVTALAIAIVARSVDTDALGQTLVEAINEPLRLALALAAFAVAFVLRTVAWRLVLPGLGFGHGLSAIHVALGANHVLPFRLGEGFRVLSVSRRAGISVEAATASTLTLRSADMVGVVIVGLIAAPTAFLDIIGPVGWLVALAMVAVAWFGRRWLRTLALGRAEIRLPGLRVFALAAAAWPIEAVLVWQAARWSSLDIGWSEAMLVTTVAVAAQIAAIAPGGFGTYEAAAVAAYAALGYDPEIALVAALAAHGLKTIYSLVFGAVALFVPAPGFLGRFRLGRPAATEAEGRELSEDSPHSDRPVVLFMPAYNEEASVGACVRRTPEQVAGHRVELLVIDDGSIDATAEVAAAAGADVITQRPNKGLGAAVRLGLAEAAARDAAAVAFCDADGEYPPEELANLIEPILNGEADYVVGSRFLGRIDHMRPHRRAGNLALTAVLRLVARHPISDGQSGYRAFSLKAAREAEVIHDFNYAQVITLDLLAKGFRYLEVPISYHFRTEGESFIKLGRYLRNVGPAVYRELNA